MKLLTHRGHAHATAEQPRVAGVLRRSAAALEAELDQTVGPSLVAQQLLTLIPEAVAARGELFWEGFGPRLWRLKGDTRVLWLESVSQLLLQ